MRDAVSVVMEAEYAQRLRSKEEWLASEMPHQPGLDTPTVAPLPVPVVVT